MEQFNLDVLCVPRESIFERRRPGSSCTNLAAATLKITRDLQLKTD